MLPIGEVPDLVQIESRLLAKFVPPLEPDDVRRCLVMALTHHQRARIKTYLSILIERTAAELLRNAERNVGAGVRRSSLDDAEAIAS